MKRSEHPSTQLLMDGDRIPKRDMLTDTNRIVHRRPIWVARWNCWCMRDHGLGEIEYTPNQYPRFRWKRS